MVPVFRQKETERACTFGLMRSMHLLEGIVMILVIYDIACLAQYTNHYTAASFHVIFDILCMVYVVV